jgi:hypothetical protein
MEYKLCPGCGATRERSEFNLNDRTGRRQPYCRVCSRRYGREHYQRNVAYYTAKARKRNKAVHDENRKQMMAYFRDHRCVDCGESDPVVLQFDHVDRSVKRLEIGRLLQNRLSWSAILAEIARCEVRCANCHQRRTARQFGWYRIARPAGVEPTTLSSED